MNIKCLESLQLPVYQYHRKGFKNFIWVKSNTFTRKIRFSLKNGLKVLNVKF